MKVLLAGVLSLFWSVFSNSPLRKRQKLENLTSFPTLKYVQGSMMWNFLPKKYVVKVCTKFLQDQLKQFWPRCTFITMPRVDDVADAFGDLQCCETEVSPHFKHPILKLLWRRGLVQFKTSNFKNFFNWCLKCYFVNSFIQYNVEHNLNRLGPGCRPAPIYITQFLD